MTTLELQTDLDRLRADLARRRDRQPPVLDLSEAVVLQDLLNDSVAFLDHLRAAERRWRELLSAGKLKYDPATAEMLTGYYRDWEVNARQRLAQLEKLEKRGIHLQFTQVFRQALEDVEDILEERSWAVLGRRARAGVDED